MLYLSLTPFKITLTVFPLKLYFTLFNSVLNLGSSCIPTVWIQAGKEGIPQRRKDGSSQRRAKTRREEELLVPIEGILGSCRSD